MLPAKAAGRSCIQANFVQIRAEAFRVGHTDFGVLGCPPKEFSAASVAKITASSGTRQGGRPGVLGRSGRVALAIGETVILLTLSLHRD